MAAKIKVGINGFGRIGRTLFRSLLHHPHIEVVQVNDIADIKTLAHLLKYDSIHGVLHETIETTPKGIIIAEKAVNFSAEKDITHINWGDAEVVIEATGKFKEK